MSRFLNSDSFFNHGKFDNLNNSFFISRIVNSETIISWSETLIISDDISLSTLFSWNEQVRGDNLIEYLFDISSPHWHVNVTKDELYLLDGTMAWNSNVGAKELINYMFDTNEV